MTSLITTRGINTVKTFPDHPSLNLSDARNLNVDLIHTSSYRAANLIGKEDMDYNDNYPSCRITYATLRIFRDDLDPDVVSSVLGVAPSDRHRKGDTRRSGYIEKSGAWFLSSKDQLESKDVQRHINWILDQLASSRGEILRQLRQEGYSMDIFCYWVSACGQRGPTLSPKMMRRLAESELEVGFDIYC